jgi:hypothetical protein
MGVGLLVGKLFVRAVMIVGVEVFLLGLQKRFNSPLVPKKITFRN